MTKQKRKHKVWVVFMTQNSLLKIKKFFKKEKAGRGLLGANDAWAYCRCRFSCCWGKQRIKSILIVFYLGEGRSPFKDIQAHGPLEKYIS